jgi:DNA polymerase-3 subunit delta'
VQLQANSPLVNADQAAAIADIAANSTPAETLAKLDAIAKSRHRIAANVRDLMVLEALAVQLRRKAK